MPTPKQPPTFQPLPADKRVVKGVFAKAVGSFVPKLAAKSFERYGFHSAEIMTAWPQVAGAEIAGFTAPERIKWPRGGGEPDGTGASGGATLVLRVEPARALDVEYRSAEIVDRINRYFGYRAVATLKLVQAPLLKPADGGHPRESSLLTDDSQIEPAPVAAALDEPVRTALEKLWSSIKRDRKRR